MAELVRVEHEDGVVSIFLNRPEQRNALSLDLLGRLGEALSRAARDGITAVILSGSEGFFSAGADLLEMSGTIDDLRIDDAIEAVTNAIRDLPIPVIAAIEGPCLGGAFDLALSCDLRIASANAFFQVPVARLGLLYNPTSMQRMHGLLGRDTLIRMLVFGERLDAQAAHQAGIVSGLAANGECHRMAMASARSTSGNIRSSVSATKGLLNSLEQNRFDAGHWQEIRRQTLSSKERRLAIAAARKRLARK